MSQYNYVSDSKAIIALQGIRLVVRSDLYYASKGGRDAFMLKIDYKGLEREIEYPSKEERDNTYDELVKRLSE